MLKEWERTGQQDVTECRAQTHEEVEVQPLAPRERLVLAEAVSRLKVAHAPDCVVKASPWAVRLLQTRAAGGAPVGAQVMAELVLGPGV